MSCKFFVNWLLYYLANVAGVLVYFHTISFLTKIQFYLYKYLEFVLQNMHNLCRWLHPLLMMTLTFNQSHNDL